MKASDFLCGKTSGSGWRAVFDWIISRANSQAILAGKNRFTTTYTHNWNHDDLEALAYEHYLGL